MPIELETYSVNCSHCGKETEFGVNDAPGLAREIEEEIDEARGETRKEVEREFDGMIDPADFDWGDPRVLHDLATAIRAGNTGEAERLLDRLAEAVGNGASEQVQLGRFNPLARRVA